MPNVPNAKIKASSRQRRPSAEERRWIISEQACQAILQDHFDAIRVYTSRMTREQYLLVLDLNCSTARKIHRMIRMQNGFTEEQAKAELEDVMEAKGRPISLVSIPWNVVRDFVEGFLGKEALEEVKLSSLTMPRGKRLGFIFSEGGVLHVIV